MAEHPPGRNSSFEDRIRSMLINGEARSNLTSTANASQRPTVRLPPTPNGSSFEPLHTVASHHEHMPAMANVRYGSSSEGVPQQQHQQASPAARQRPSQKQRKAQGHSQNGSYFAPPVAQSQPHHPRHYSGHLPPHPSIDPNAFQRGGHADSYQQQPPHPVNRQLFDPSTAQPFTSAHLLGARLRQAQYLDILVSQEVPRLTMSEVERAEKDAFRLRLETIIREICDEHSESLPPVSLEAFGSFRSGFANANSDMDLAIVLQDGTSHAACSSLDENDMPRLLEKRLLELGYGARLLTNTRVPIIKICQKPDQTLLNKLRVERQQWDELPIEKKYPHLHPSGPEPTEADVDSSIVEDPPADNLIEPPASSPKHPQVYITQKSAGSIVTMEDTINPVATVSKEPPDVGQLRLDDGQGPDAESNEAKEHSSLVNEAVVDGAAPPRPLVPRVRAWARERKKASLDFPKDGVGIQCDINFFNPLGLHNTQLLRCYSLCDARVQPMVLFVKSWAKRRKINSSYSGTLSSYGYVLMVLHYLINVVQPPVLPNLQGVWRPDPRCTPPGATSTEVDGWTVDFWNSEAEIQNAVRAGQMSANQSSVGALLAGFFDYYSSQSHGPQFRWMTDVLSLRTPGGILSKTEKGWIKAVTEEGDGGKKVQHRYLFCIEDPFELSHNVARTVIHPGIVAIRDEFRRARRILFDVGGGRPAVDGQLLDEYVDPVPPSDNSKESLGSIASNANQASDAGVQAVALQTPPTHAGPSHSRGRPKPHQPRTAPTSVPRQMPGRTLDVTDNESFPALGPAKHRKSGAPSRTQREKNSASITSPRAKAHLEGVRERQAAEGGSQSAQFQAQYKPSKNGVVRDGWAS